MRLLTMSATVESSIPKLVGSIEGVGRLTHRVLRQADPGLDRDGSVTHDSNARLDSAGQHRGEILERVRLVNWLARALSHIVHEYVAFGSRPRLRSVSDG
jgi:hypothetical protein